MKRNGAKEEEVMGHRNSELKLVLPTYLISSLRHFVVNVAIEEEVDAKRLCARHLPEIFS